MRKDVAQRAKFKMEIKKEVRALRPKRDKPGPPFSPGADYSPSLGGSGSYEPEPTFGSVGRVRPKDRAVAAAQAAFKK